MTRPWLEAANVVAHDRSFHASGNIASAGGGLAAHYLATWVIASLIDRQAAEDALRYVVPVGEEEQYIGRALAAIEPFLQDDSMQMQR
jgi:hypothetical protein